MTETQIAQEHEDEEGGETARDAWCQKCRAFTEIIWTRVEVARLQGLQIVTFKGVSMSCRICDFEITKVGWAERGKLS